MQINYITENNFLHKDYWIYNNIFDILDFIYENQKSKQTRTVLKKIDRWNIKIFSTLTPYLLPNHIKLFRNEMKNWLDKF